MNAPEQAPQDLRKNEPQGLTVIPALPEHAFLLASSLREEDRAECLLMRQIRGGDENIEDILLQGVEKSFESFFAHDRSGPVALFGVRLHGRVRHPVWGEGIQVGIPWLLASPGIARHRREVLHMGRAFVRLWSRQCAWLCNVIWAEHASALRYVRAVGFCLGDVIQFPGHKERFYHFHRQGRLHR